MHFAQNFPPRVLPLFLLGGWRHFNLPVKDLLLCCSWLSEFFLWISLPFVPFWFKMLIYKAMGSWVMDLTSSVPVRWDLELGQQFDLDLRTSLEVLLIRCLPSKWLANSWVSLSSLSPPPLKKSVKRNQKKQRKQECP